MESAKRYKAVLRLNGWGIMRSARNVLVPVESVESLMVNSNVSARMDAKVCFLASLFIARTLLCLLIQFLV